MPQENIHFVTGRLAATALENQLVRLSESVGFQYSIQVLPITVAALLTPQWIAPRLVVPDGTDRIILPGYCLGDLSPLTDATDVPVQLGPKDLRRLPEFFGQQKVATDLDTWSIEIIAEINHAPRLSPAELVAQAEALVRQGADIVDVGCEPNSIWAGVGDAVRSIVDLGIRVSIDSLQPKEIGAAVSAGAELVLSVNQSNCQAAIDWGCEVVVIPDEIHEIHSMDQTIEFLASHDIKMRIDPILEPIGFGFANSLNRYWLARQRWPEAEMMMGIGNLTELSDVDSAGINFLLLAICEELGICSVLTTQVINWARTSVKECDLARRLVHHSILNGVPPKHLSEDLIVLRDAKIFEHGEVEIERLASNIKDNNYRIFAERDQIHLLGNGQHHHDTDPFLVFDQLMASQPGNVDASHAFYLGYEMCKALVAIQLGKQYTQDESLDWGHLTVPETDRHRLKRGRTSRQSREQ